MKVPKELYLLAKRFQTKGYQCFLVGGAVRDMIMGRKLSDFDITTNALPEDVMNIFHKTIPTGIKHGTVTVLFRNLSFEITTFRIDGKYSDMRRPDEVTFTPSIYEDLERRDFTINAIAFDLIQKRMLDPHKGKEDLKKKVIKAIGNSEKRFEEDALRLIRACRFATQLNFTIEKQTFLVIKHLAANINNISAERIRDELIKIICSSNPAYGFELLRETDLLQVILPELNKCYGIKQGSLHSFDVYYHSLYSCEAAPSDNLPLRLAALFHDIGKAKTFSEDKEGKIHFYRHEHISSDLIQNILKRLKFSNDILNKVMHLILNHMFNYQETWSDAAVRRFIARVGLDYIDDLVVLRRADQIGMNRKVFRSRHLSNFKKRIKNILKQDSALNLQDLKINGNDIMEYLKLPAGQTIGTILNYLFEAVLEDPELNNKDKLLSLAKNFYNDRLQV